MQSIVLVMAVSTAWPTPPATLPPAAAAPSPALAAVVAPSPADTGAHRRPRAVEYSDFYGTRLAIHRYASYATIPLFIAEYALGQALFNTAPDSVSSSVRTAHGLVADGLAGLFGVNTVTGVWNLWDSRHDSDGAARRYIHAGLMLLSDAGFVATAQEAPSHRRELEGTVSPTARSAHRTLAIASMGTALASYLMMLVWKR